MIIQAQFDFEDEEVLAVMEAIYIHQIALLSHPTQENLEKSAALGRFAHKMGPVIWQGMLLAKLHTMSSE